MESMIVDPREIYGFFPYAKASDEMIALISRRATNIIKDIPLFQIPEEYRDETYFRFLLADGNHRREAYERLSLWAPCKIYAPGEIIDVENDDLSPFRHQNDPRLFVKLLYAFVHRQDVHERILQKIKEKDLPD